MKLWIGAVLLSQLACGGTTEPANPDAAWVGSWHAVSVDGNSAPTTFVWANSTWRLNSQTFILGSGTGGRIGLWSSDIDEVGGSLTMDGSASISWSVSGSMLTTIVIGAKAGRVLTIMDFSIQPDGSLIRVEDNNTYIYRKN